MSATFTKTSKFALFSRRLVIYLLVGNSDGFELIKTEYIKKILNLIFLRYEKCYTVMI